MKNLNSKDKFYNMFNKVNKMTLNESIEERENPIEGGVGDKSTVNDFDREQLKAGIKVEMEHTDDPIVALDIVLDHLTENPQYYGDNGEGCAACNAQHDAESKGEFMSEKNLKSYSNDEKNQVEIDNPTLYPDGWKQMDGIFMNPNNPMNPMNLYKKAQNEEINKDVDDQLYPKGWREKDKRMTSPDLYKEPDNDADRLLGYKPNNVGDYQGIE